jgi:hypothetical protein
LTIVMAMAGAKMQRDVNSVELPYHGRVGEFVVLTPLGETVFDSADPGLSSVWVCVQASDAELNKRALWTRVHVDDVWPHRRQVPRD